MQKDYQKKYMEIIKKVVLSHINKNEHFVFLFGSRVYNNFKRTSDVDIGILGDKPIGKIYYKILNEIEESNVPLKVDVIDFSLVDEKFKKEALKNIIAWNKPKDLKIN